MVQDGESFGSYYLDSNPFTVRLLKPETPSAQPHTGDESDPIRLMGMMLIGITALGGTALIRIKTGK